MIAFSGTDETSCIQGMTMMLLCVQLILSLTMNMPVVVYFCIAFTFEVD